MCDHYWWRKTWICTRPQKNPPSNVTIQHWHQISNPGCRGEVQCPIIWVNRTACQNSLPLLGSQPPTNHMVTSVYPFNTLITRALLASPSTYLRFHLATDDPPGAGPTWRSSGCWLRHSLPTLLSQSLDDGHLWVCRKWLIDWLTLPINSLTMSVN